ncbi:MAG TPA: radical SAM protein [Vicinamibacterales bacterium]|nr:radical SAM protein [Vicinamibacterales bacterium]
MSSPPLVLLINPRMCTPRRVRLPLSLLTLAAKLQGRYRYQVVDGNVADVNASIGATLGDSALAMAAVSVMPGPQVPPAIEVSRTIRAVRPDVPVVWGGYFPTLYPDAAINAPYVDAVVRGPGEDTLLELLEHWPSAAHINGVTWRDGNRIVHNAERALASPTALPPLPYDALPDLEPYLRPTFLGRRTAVHQAAIGCRYRCRFCGVVSMFNGQTRLQHADRVIRDLAHLQHHCGADSVQFYDHNFFDRQQTSEETLEALAQVRLPWWCYARADALAAFTPRMWSLARESRMRMAYIGAETGSNEALRRMQKGGRVETTLEVAARLRENGITPEFSFVLGGPDDPEADTEATFEFIRRLKRAHPACEVVLYFYSPTPQRDPRSAARDGAASLPRLERYGPAGPALPTTPEEWSEPRWVRWVCHQDAPWLTPRLRQRVRDFARVLECRFPTVQDHHTPGWQKSVLREMARWRWATRTYARPLELALARKGIALRQPQVESL